MHDRSFHKKRVSSIFHRIFLIAHCNVEDQYKCCVWPCCDIGTHTINDIMEECPSLDLLTHSCRSFQHLLSERRQSLGQQMLERWAKIGCENATVGKNGLSSVTLDNKLKFQEYLNILGDHRHPSMDFYFPDESGIFQDDNAPIHRACVVISVTTRYHFLIRNGIHNIII